MRAVKGNKEYIIDEVQKQQYVRDGYDILNDEGTVIQSGAGKTVPFEKYQAALDENAVLKQKVTDFQAALDKKTPPEK